MRRCDRCGQSQKDSDRFCTHCGQPPAPPPSARGAWIAYASALVVAGTLAGAAWVVLSPEDSGKVVPNPSREPVPPVSPMNPKAPPPGPTRTADPPAATDPEPAPKTEDAHEPGPARATGPVDPKNPPILARLEIEEGGARMSGSLNFPPRPGVVSGALDLDVASSPEAPPLARNGQAVPGRFRLRIELEGKTAGGYLGTIEGTARVLGSFANQAGQQATVRGEGVFRGTANGSLGLVEIGVTCPGGIALEGLNLVSPQPFSVFPPALAFARTLLRGADPLPGTDAWEREQR